MAALWYDTVVADNNQVLVQTLIDERVLKTPLVIEAFRQIKREDFVLPQDRQDAYVDAPLPIGYGATISQPTTVAIMLELLQPQRGENVLDVGSGSGWTAALLAHCVGPSGRVFGIEIVPELVNQANDNLKQYALTNVTVFQGNGHAGLSKHAPFNVIHVAAAADHVPPKLVTQLAEAGRMVVPVGQPIQDLVFVTKQKGTIREKRYYGFQFVPLVE